MVWERKKEILKASAFNVHWTLQTYILQIILSLQYIYTRGGKYEVKLLGDLSISIAKMNTKFITNISIA